MPFEKKYQISEVYFFARGNKGKNNLLKIAVASQIPKAVEGPIQEKKQQKPLTTSKEKECCTIDTDGNASINTHLITNKGSNNDNNKNNNNDINNISNVNNNKSMNINNNGCKINENKSDNNNNLDNENNISNNIDNKYSNNIEDNNSDNKIKGHKINGNGSGHSTSIINIDNKINSNDGSENTSNNHNKGNGKNINNHNKGNGISEKKKTTFIIGDNMIKKIDGYLLTSSVNHKYIVKIRSFL